MKKMMTAITILSVSLSAFAGGTTNESITCSEYAHGLRVQQMMVKYHEETLQGYKELADDSRLTSNISFGLFTISSLLLNSTVLLPGTILKAGSLGEKIAGAPLIVAGKFADLFTHSSYAVGDIAVTTAIIVGTVATFSPTIVSAGNGIYRMKTKIGEKEVFVNFSNDDMDKLLIDSEFLLEKIQSERNAVDLNYSRLINVLTLGGKDAATMKKLYELAKFEHEILKVKLAAYSALNGQCK